MNKMLTVSLVAVLGVAGGGAYMVMNPEKNYSQYIPEPVSEFLGEYVPGFSGLNASTAPTESTMVIEEYAQEAEEPFMEQQVEATQVAPQAEAQAETDPVQEMQNSVEEPLLPQSDDNVISDVMDEIQQSINEVSVEKIAENNKSNKVNPQAISLEKKIDKVSSEIAKIDLENNQLEQKFQEILRKNRDLAKQLKEIDEKLAATD